VYLYDIIKKEVSLIRSAFLILLIGSLFALLIFSLCGLLYGLITAIAVFLLSITKILFFHDAETFKERIGDSIVTAFAVAILVGVIASILAGIIHGFRAGRESIYCDESSGLLAGMLALIAMILLTFIKTIIDTIYNIYREE